jgi:subtilase family serine protease
MICSSRPLQRSSTSYRVNLGVVSALALVSMMASGVARAAVKTAAESVAELIGSYRPTTDLDTGAFSSSRMTVEVVLAPSHQAELADLLDRVYDPQDPSYHQWLATGEFYARFAPSDAQVAAVSEYLQGQGLAIERSSSPFLVRASGPSPTVEAAFGTTLHSYRNPKGITYFSNTSALRLPADLAPGVLGVVGVSNTVRLRSHVRVAPTAVRNGSGTGFADCETAYVTRAELFALFNNNVGFPYGYGGGPGCNGLTPSQTNSLYGAPFFGPATQGAGVNLAVFELSAYQHSDIDTWTGYFYGPFFRAPLVDINVDGGPLHPICPAGDQCPPDINGYAGDIEVDADIEMSLTIAPFARTILVYNAPNDFTGQTELDEYTKIASDNIADVLSSSWGLCENDAGAALVQAENVVFEQMALQGQSAFGAAGDTGAFDCIRSDGTTIVNVDDPPSQPWVTSVGGTSFESDNPGFAPFPRYPAGVETVWNVDNLCNTSANEGGVPGGDSGYPLSGFFWCAATGAGGGGSSQFWGRPHYQHGRGITNRYTTYGNGSTHCALAAPGTPCREVPDVSANADPYTGYAEYCTGSAATPYSVCAQFSGAQTPPGWFAIGGTSLSSPLFSATIGDRDGFWHGRVGNANELFYRLYREDPEHYFHDITGIGQSTNNNGLFPTTPGYDLATGIGTPKMRALITETP